MLTYNGGASSQPVQHFLSLGVNLNATDYGNPEIGKDINLITQPESYIIYADSSGNVDYLYASGSHFSSPEAWTSVVPSPRHEGLFNGAFLDGHVGTATLGEYWNTVHFIR
jgi:prepilin-type processing-associated H-X9-DG protein